MEKVTVWGISADGWRDKQEPDENLVGRWLFNEGAGGTLYDISGNGNHGTLTIGVANMKKFTVEAARTTGEWLDTPALDGDVNFEEWLKMTDTDDVHYDHFENFDENNYGSSDGVTCAIEVTWVD